jgi:hypothetical protein
MSGQNPDETRSIKRGEPFLARWSRRKAQDRMTPEPAVTAAPLGAASAAEPAIETSAAAVAEMAAVKPAGAPIANSVVSPSRGNDEQPPVELPDIDLLDQDSDYSAFLAPGADADLRRRALRKLFSSPKFNAFDGLDTYRDDFTTFPPLADVITVDMKFEAERLASSLLLEDKPAIVAAAPALPHAPTDASAPPDAITAPPTVGHEHNDDHIPA